MAREGQGGLCWRGDMMMMIMMTMLFVSVWVSDDHGRTESPGWLQTSVPTTWAWSPRSFEVTGGYQMVNKPFLVKQSDIVISIWNLKDILFKKWWDRGLIKWLILMACQPFWVILCPEVWELLSFYIHIYIFCIFCNYPTPPPRTGCDTRSIFKWSTISLNKEFSFT